MIIYPAIPLVVGFIIQLLKVIIDFSIEKKLHIHYLRRAWGFPSVHSWISSSLTTLIGFTQWINTPEFAIALIFSLLFWYDAINVRYEAWKHAKFINYISNELNAVLGLEHDPSLKERLWHTFLEVVWGIVIGFLLTLAIISLLSPNLPWTTN